MADEPVRSRFRFHEACQLGLLQGQGVLTLDGWERAAEQILDWPASGGTRRLLSDRRHMTGDYPAWMQDRIVGFIRDNALKLGHVQWAVVLPENPGALKMVRETAESSQGTRVRIRAFTDLGEALRWLLGVYEDEQVAELIHWVDQVG